MLKIETENATENDTNSTGISFINFKRRSCKKN